MKVSALGPRRRRSFGSAQEAVNLTAVRISLRPTGGLGELPGRPIASRNLNHAASSVVEVTVGDDQGRTSIGTL